MKHAIFALIVALGLAAAFVGYASISKAGDSGSGGNYVDERTGRTTPP